MEGLLLKEKQLSFLGHIAANKVKSGEYKDTKKERYVLWHLENSACFLSNLNTVCDSP